MGRGIEHRPRPGNGDSIRVPLVGVLRFSLLSRYRNPIVEARTTPSRRLPREWSALTSNEALTAIAAGQIRPVYLLHGPEDFLRQEVLAALREHVVAPGTETFNDHLFDPGPHQLVEALGLAQTLPFFAERRLVVVRDCPLLLGRRGQAADEGETDDTAGAAGAEAGLLNYLKHPNPSTCLVFTAGEGLDSRRRASKALLAAGAGVECAELKPADAVHWAELRASRLNKRLGLEAAQALVERAGTSLRGLATELEKLAAYTGTAHEIKARDVIEVVAGAPAAEVFDLVDAIGQKQGGRALLLLEGLLRDGEEPIRLLALIAWRMRLLLLVKALTAKGYGPRDGPNAARVHPFVYQKAQQQARGFGRDELVRALERILSADVAMKTGMDPRIMLETVVAELVS